MMDDGSIQTIDIEGAAQKLGGALDSLESRLDDLFDRLNAIKPVEREAEALRRDRSRLANDLDAARARERELQELADEASDALGAAIKEVREALGKV
ncbi:MAG: hypothetical protein CME88_04385 [Hirschia sp.]|nr:hypothetical protein [Hirschia sp.]MBF17598.1 hypothetical protein [Hirschia sp.]|tara:strand:+ start:141 stop:431 length:291 start_codon:yes stop_codon:yes gene_type:complete